ncbi:MAG: hydantoinase/oxoprolinase family protein [Alphaproteobacteria bacterium]|nr:hydantoinase/oxoprolinase family protein [Alphaproteobacteria bacterium]
MSWFIGVDVGGTFTDFHCLNERTGEAFVHKAPSTPDNPARAIVEGVRTVADRLGIGFADIHRLAHGTTVATNALIQRKGGKVALVTTKGFRDLLEIGRQVRPHMYSLQEDHPEPLVPRHWRFEVDERMTADGTAERTLDGKDVARAAEAIRTAKVDSVAVGFLFSFLNPEHERRAADALAAALPGVHVSRSSEVQPEFREYERFSTTVLNAYLQPVLARYLADLGDQVGRLSGTIEIGINQSAGGLMSIGRAHRFPVRTALSGPAAGAVGAIHVAKLSSRPNVVTLDMGGTSADVALIRDYRTDTAHDRQVGGFPVRLPMIDINTIGAGGGSIAWFAPDGLLKVGPTSAGAVPGPACYGQGGTEATVTDANLVLGRLSPRGLLDGEVALDAAAARRAIQPVAERLGFTVERTAHGILAIVVANMVRAIRTVSVERGHDPRSYALMPFGGAGPLHATDVARSLGMREILVPPAPGILCAQGLVVSDLKEDFVRTRRTRLAAADAPAMARVIGDLAEEARRWLDAEGIAADDRETLLALDMRYVGQNFELPVRLPTAALPDAMTLARLFAATHEQSYGYANLEAPIEVINFRLTARARRAETTPPPPATPPTAPPAPVGRRAVHFRWEAADDTSVYRRDALKPGHRLTGPMVVEQLDATTLLYPGDRMTVDAAGSLVIEAAP